jgi:ribosomal-protein-alanine N-acetyltransferase
MAALHARCFVRPAPWSEAALSAALAAPGAFLCDAPEGFAIGRAAAGEAELLTIAVAPEARRRGIGAALLAGFEAGAAARGAVRAFLEVASDNPGARALYDRAGWEPAGLRRGYYGGGVDAVVMHKTLIAPESC